MSTLTRIGVVSGLSAGITTLLTLIAVIEHQWSWYWLVPAPFIGGVLGWIGLNPVEVWHQCILAVNDIGAMATNRIHDLQSGGRHVRFREAAILSGGRVVPFVTLYTGFILILRDLPQAGFVEILLPCFVLGLILWGGGTAFLMTVGDLEPDPDPERMQSAVIKMGTLNPISAPFTLAYIVWVLARDLLATPLRSIFLALCNGERRACFWGAFLGTALGLAVGWQLWSPLWGALVGLIVGALCGPFLYQFAHRLAPQQPSTSVGAHH